MTLRLDHAAAACAARTRVISTGGMEIICDGENFSYLLPEGYRLAPDARTRMQFTVTLDSGLDAVDGEGRVLSARRLAQDRFSLGFEILSLPQDAARRLVDFLDRCATED